MVTYEHLEKGRTERAVKDTKAAEAVKEVITIASATPEAEYAATGAKERGRRRKTAALGAELAARKAKTGRTGGIQDVAEAEQDVPPKLQK
jgi:hypothetical protein